MLRYRQIVDKIPWRIVGGVALATPVVAVAQGSLLLYDYRRNHSNAPLPDMPSRGLVIAGYSTSTRRMEPGGLDAVKDQESLRTSTTSSALTTPLRLLVIGDSLAAGVGTSESSTPVLPHSIAVHLSSALHGRAVVWTCVGVPGQSSASLVHAIDELATTTTDMLLQRWWSEWHVRRQRIAAATRETQAWWAERRTLDDIREEEASSSPKEGNRIIRWWNRSKKQAKNDLESLKLIVRKVWVDETKEEHQLVRRETQRSLLRRTTTRTEPDMMMGSYDIAVVLTGLNDLKESYLPFMMPSKNGNSEDESSSRGLREQLVNVLKALESKMRTILPTNAAVLDQEDQQQLEQKQQQDNGPLVVFPALPYEPTVLNRVPPLSWFLIPLLQTVDQKKQDLAELYPDRVLYVAAPDHATLNHAEQMDDKDKPSIPIALQLNDIRVDVQERIEKLMRQYYRRDEQMSKDDEWHEDETSYCPKSKPSVVISADGIHPSDRGYQAWGEHIARKIVEEWEQQKATKR